MFGVKEFPGVSDNEMKMWIVYRCNGGKDTTRLTGAKKCGTTPGIKTEIWERAVKGKMANRMYWAVVEI